VEQAYADEVPPVIYTVAILLLIVLWVGGLLTSAMAAGEIHDFVYLAILCLLVRVIQGRQSPA
jgi:hypothetical protein